MLDRDLEFINSCTNEQLKTLVDILVFDNDGKKRITESLSSTKLFSECYPNDLKPLIPSVMNEIQLYGGNTFFNLVRGHGVSYREILEDVCDRLKVNYNKKLSVELLEAELLRKVAVTVIEKMTDEDIKKFDENLDKRRLLDAITRGNGVPIMATVAVLIARFSQNIGKKGVLMVFGRALGPRLATFANPVLIGIGAVWTALDIASPAYRVTVPFAITTAFLRRQMNTDAEDEVMKNIFS